ncbi:MAG TPA: hypothetical protein VFW78_04695 [Bacteroidia bacterium]|nr:hypothetical protein [Bacteroidia bacterium]
MLGKIFKAILVGFIPAFLLFLGRWDQLNEFITNHNLASLISDVSSLQIGSFIVGLSLTSIVYPIWLIRKERQIDIQNEKLAMLFDNIKLIYFKHIKDKLKFSNAQLNVRIFIPKKGFIAFYNRFIHGKRFLQVKYIPGLTDKIDDIKKLEFEVTPQRRGLVSKTFHEKAIRVDCDVTPENYNLTDYQRNKTHDVRFCTTAPFFDTNSNVIAVLAVDSPDDIQLSESEAKIWDTAIKYYCAIVDKHVTIQKTK